MKKNRLIFYAVFGAFHIFLFFFSLYIDNQKENIQFLLSLQGKIWLLKYGSFLGLVLLVTDIIWEWSSERSFKKENDHLNHELNMLKAKLFDLQEAAKSSTAQPPSESSGKKQL